VFNHIELVIGNANTELTAGPPVNPGLVEGAVVQAKDGLDVGVLAVTWCNTKPSLASACSDIIVNEADAIGRR
jgi:hypothetical protein